MSAAPIDPGPDRGLALPVLSAPPPGVTTLVSRRADGSHPTGPSGQPAISQNGRWVAFTSLAADLVAGDANTGLDVFLHDRQAGTTIRLPGPGGVPLGPGQSAIGPSISADGSVVAYTIVSTGTFTVAPPGPFVVAWVRASGATEVVSITPTGAVAFGSAEASLSGDGRYVAFTSTASLGRLDRNGSTSDVAVRDRQTGTTTIVSVTPNGFTGSGPSFSPAISRNGRVVAFSSDAEDLVAGDEDGETDVFARDLVTGATTRVSVPMAGSVNGPSRDPAISANGRYVAFESSATNLVPGSPDGRHVFLRDRTAATTTLVSVGEDGSAIRGENGQASISTDGRIVAFASTMPPQTAVAPGGGGGGGGGGLGGIVLAAPIEGPTEVYARDVVTGETILVSQAIGGGGGGGQSTDPAIAGTGRYVAFASSSSSLVANDTNQAFDVFLRDLPPIPILSPPAIDYGLHGLASTGASASAELRNDGWGPFTGQPSQIEGGAAADFSVVADGCDGVVLRRGDSCTVEVYFLPTRTGDRSATLLVAFSAPGSPGTVRLLGRGALAALELDPPLGRPGIVTVVTGTGFPAGVEVRLAWDRGITPHLRPILTDADGGFQIGVLVFHKDILGERELIATPADGTSFDPLTAPFTVNTPSSQPPRFAILSPFDGDPLMLVFRR